MTKGDRYIIGTAAWRQNYGVLKPLSALNVDQIFSILDYCSTLKFDTLDTALIYGDIVPTLANYSTISEFNVISKFSFKLDNLRNSISEIENNLLYFSKAKSLSLLIHNIDFLHNKSKWCEILRANIINNYEDINFGISLYTPKEFNRVLKSSFTPDFIQFPICFGDLRWQHFMENLSPELLNKLSKIELHARSIFLQGSLLHKSKKHCFKQKLYNSEMTRWWKFVEKCGAEPYSICLNPIIQNPQINKINIGINSISELLALRQFLDSDHGRDDQYDHFSFSSSFLDIRNWKRA
ncbi:hypothetical protein N8714_01335 [Rhodobacteraceae bacterium]|nr:hypothetical protein [Paracoccaceae bacterium]